MKYRPTVRLVILLSLSDQPTQMLQVFVHGIIKSFLDLSGFLICVIVKQVCVVKQLCCVFSQECGVSGQNVYVYNFLT